MSTATRKKAKPAAEFSAADRIVADPATGLEWSPTLGNSQVNWATAKKLAAECRAGNHDDWRLPTPQELLSIVDYGRFNPAANTDLFPDMKPSWYWTGTPDASSPSDVAWGVHFHNGGVLYHYLQDYYAFVRAVRSSRASQ